MTEQLTEKPNITANPDKLGKLLFVLATLSLACAPSQFAAVNVGGLSVGLSEIFLALAAYVWMLRWFTMRDTGSLPPLTHWLVVGAALIGIFVIKGDKLETSVLKEAAQLFLYLVVAVTVFRSVFTTVARTRTAFTWLLATTSLAVLIAVGQWAMLQRDYQPDPQQRVVFASKAARVEDSENAPEADKKKMGMWDSAGVFHAQSHAKLRPIYSYIQTPTAVSSTFGSWNAHGYYPSRTAYAAFLALVLPFALALLLSAGARKYMVWIILLLLGAAVSVLAGLVVPAILAGLLAAGIALGPKVGRWAMLGILLYLLPMALVHGFNQQEVIQEPYRLQMPAQQAAFRYDNGKQHLKKFWGEQVAALQIIPQNPLFGAGAGKYQESVSSSAYGHLGAVSSQRLESDEQSGYILITATLGFLGLAALLALFGQYLGLAWQQVRNNTNPWTAALFGAMVALVILTAVTNPWVRGTSVLIAALFAVIGNGVFATASPIGEEEGQNDNSINNN